MPFKYYVECWVYPRSGFDIARKNKIIHLFKKVLFDMLPQKEEIESIVEKFCKEHDGLILEPLVLESDTEITNPEKELMPEIRKKHPEARLVSCQKIPEIKSEIRIFNKKD